jgi:protein CpxP
MNTLRKQILIALTVLGMGTTTLAAHADEGGWHHGGSEQGGHRGGQMGKRMAHFRAHLHDKLKLSAAQETAWTAYVAATEPKMAAGAHPDGKGQHPDFASMTAPQKLQMFDDMQKKRLAMQESHLAAMKTFYATLTPEQQKTFDRAINMAMHHRHHGHGHHHEGREHYGHHDGDHHGWN